MDKQLTQLEDLLHQEIAAHEALLTLVKRKLAALRQADRKAITQLCVEENALVQRIGELAKMRLVHMADLTQAVDPAAKEPLRLLELAQRLPEPTRSRLLVLRTTLRQRMDEVKQQSGLVHRATESLVHHMHGLVQSIGSLVTGVGVYTRKGRMPQAAAAVSTFTTTA